MTKRREKKLTQKRENFCNKFIECGNASEAYRFAYPTSVNWKKDAVWSQASVLMRNSLVLARVEELREKSQERFNISIEQKKAWLKEVIERCMQHEAVLDSEGNPTGEYKFNSNDTIKAINELNKMDGDHAPTKVASTDVTGKKDMPVKLNINFV